MKIELWPLSKIKPYARNPRINDSAVDAVAASIRQFGFRKPIVVDRKGVIVCGHTCLRAAEQLGLAKAPVHVARDLSAEQVQAYRIADNRAAELAEWDWKLLGVELGELKAADYDVAALGLGEDWLARAMGGGRGGATDPDDAPAPPAKPTTRPGDLYLLGEHRLLCGDSTNADDVLRATNGEPAGLMNTDPPYGVAYANDERPNPGVAKPRVAKPRVANDVLADEALQAFLERAFAAASNNALKPRAAWYLWHADLTQGFFAAAAAAANVVLHRQIIWVKPVLLLGRGQYHWKHEPCFMGWVKGNTPPDYGEGNGERTQTTVWEVGTVSNQDRKQFDHSTPKPVALFEIPIVKHLKPGEVCYEPFAGSGPQFIAAEQLGRRCFGIEIEPKYCDVIVARWEAFTGKKAERLRDGQTTAKGRGKTAAASNGKTKTKTRAPRKRSRAA